MIQKVKANRIVLWLHPSDIGLPLPAQLCKLQRKGLEIRYYPKGIRSYTKLIPAIEQYPDDVIITIDDDVMYDRNTLYDLIRTYKETSDTVCGLRCHRMKLNADGGLLPYTEWEWDDKMQDTEPDEYIFPTGVGGVLYPPGALGVEALNSEAFMSICPTADDVWFKWMTRRNHILSRKCIRTHTFGFKQRNIANTAETPLSDDNVNGGKNDIQIRRMLEKYGWQ